MRRVLRIAAGLVVSFAIAATLGEVLARVTHIVDRMNPFPRRLYTATTVADLPYRLTPGVHIVVRESVIDVNRLGIRDRDAIAPQPAPGVRRILVLGDSVAFGWLQAVERAFPRQLEDRLVAAGERVEVLNAGVPGYSAVTEAAWFRELGVALAPSTVLVAVNMNDFDRAPHLNGLGILSATDDRIGPWSPANWSELYLALRWSLIRLWFARPIEEQPAPAPRVDGEWDRWDRFASTIRKNFYKAPHEPEWSAMQAAWRDIASRARSHGARVVFLLFPDGDQLSTPTPDLGPQRRLTALCAAEGFECLDLYPTFAADGRGPLLFTDIMHPNDDGHALAATAVAAYLRRGDTARGGAATE